MHTHTHSLDSVWQGTVVSIVSCQCTIAQTVALTPVHGEIIIHFHSLYFVVAFCCMQKCYLSSRLLRMRDLTLYGNGVNVNIKQISHWLDSYIALTIEYYIVLYTVLRYSLCFSNPLWKVCIVSCLLSLSSWAGFYPRHAITIWLVCVDLKLNTKQTNIHNKAHNLLFHMHYYYSLVIIIYWSRLNANCFDWFGKISNLKYLIIH